MIRSIWGDPERFKKTYFPPELGGTVYLAGDGAVRDATTGYFRIIGRMDDLTGETISQDTSTLENPAILEQLGQAY